MQSCYRTPRLDDHEKPAIFEPDFAAKAAYLGKVKLATTRAEQRRWMEQWRGAAIALDEIRRDDLANLTEEQARREINSLLEIPGGWRSPRLSGLIEQQALFQRLARK
jgi:hypothetical protein